MILELDMGNTRLKWRVRRGEETLKAGSCLSVEFSRQPPGDLAALEGIAEVRLSCVAGVEKEQEVLAFAESQWQLPVSVARTSFDLAGVKNSYQDPSRMGVDRWLAMVAAYNLAGHACLVVDSGSSTTIDFVASTGEHRGGFILPGLDMMQNSLLSGTGQVRFQKDRADNSLQWGRDTAQAVEHGCLFMTVAVVEKAWNSAQEDEGDQSLTLFLCGGGAESLAEHLSVPFERASQLVLDGLRYTAQANA